MYIRKQWLPYNYQSYKMNNHQPNNFIWLYKIHIILALIVTLYPPFIKKYFPHIYPFLLRKNHYLFEVPLFFKVLCLSREVEVCFLL